MSKARSTIHRLADCVVQSAGLPQALGQSQHRIAAETGVLQLQAIATLQRAQVGLDVHQADLEASEALHGPDHPTSAYFREIWRIAQVESQELRAQYGRGILNAAKKSPPKVVLCLRVGGRSEILTPDRRGCLPLPSSVNTILPADTRPSASTLIVPIGGCSYHAVRIDESPVAPRIWRLRRLYPVQVDGPYYACRLTDGSTQCDCADWIYKAESADHSSQCKHLAALASLGWI